MATFRRAKHSALLGQIIFEAVLEQGRLRMDSLSAKSMDVTIVLSRHAHNFSQLPNAEQRSVRRVSIWNKGRRDMAMVQ